MRRIGGVGLVALVAFSAGCSLLVPKPAQHDYYVLTPLARAPAPARMPVAGRETTPSEDLPLLVVDRVTIPDYLDRASMATRIAEHRLTYSKRDRWAEPLEESLTRTLRQNLGLLLEPRVLVQPRRLGTPPDYAVAIDLLRFERRGTRDVELWARFTIRTDGEPVHAGETRLVVAAPGESAADAAAALSQALATMSRTIADAVLAQDPRTSRTARPAAPELELP